ncbi:uncharacterized protein E2C01_037159 [Portunus trituberculatus]|uniref:RNA-directed DNA polymerase n=1 Tax=Portunus trituberculatus TaxID=210409 RepID=A0A5B7F7E1_PORTR|nr:uncharacterized protein [Portunus trituberculatus]
MPAAVSKVQSGDLHPHKTQEASWLCPYYAVGDRLMVNEDLDSYTSVERNIHLVTPASLHHKVASSLHLGHQGLIFMLFRVRHSVYWPGMEGDVQHHCNLCQDCEKHAPSLPLGSLIITPLPVYPYQQVVVDMFKLEGNIYLAYADRLTGWLELHLFPNDASSSKIMTHLRKLFTSWQLAAICKTVSGVRQHCKIDQHWKGNLKQRE